MLIWPKSGFCSVFQGFFFNFRRQTFVSIFWNKYRGYWWDGGQHFLWIPLFFLLCLKGEVKRAMVWGVKHLGGERRSRPRHDCDTRTRGQKAAATSPHMDNTRLVANLKTHVRCHVDNLLQFATWITLTSLLTCSNLKTHVGCHVDS